MTTTFDGPGVYRDLDEDTYHADPVPEGSLSYSGAKKLLDCPARFIYERENRTDKKEFDFGHVAHRLILGAGATPHIVDAQDWRTKAAQEARKAARAEGKAPILRDDYRKALAMRAQVRRHPIASRLFTGESEVSAFARDPETGLMLRSRFDHFTTLRNGRPVLIDFKTVAGTANPQLFGRDAWSWGYDVQDPWYRMVAHEAGLAEDPAFLFVIQEKTPPYLVSVIELTDEAREIGAERGRYARRLFIECMTTGEWPGYPPVVHPVNLPGYAAAPYVPTQGEAA